MIESEDENILSNDKLNRIANNINKLVEVSSKPSNYAYSEYLFGLANGLILAQSLITGKPPVFLKQPETFLANEKDANRFILPGLTDYHLKKAELDKEKED